MVRDLYWERDILNSRVLRNRLEEDWRKIGRRET